MGDCGAIDPAGRSKLGPSAEAIAKSEEEGGSGNDVGWEFPIGLPFRDAEGFAEGNEGGEDEDESDVGERGV